MKKIFYVLAILGLGFNSFAQKSKKNNSENSSNTTLTQSQASNVSNTINPSTAPIPVVEPVQTIEQVVSNSPKQEVKVGKFTAEDEITATLVELAYNKTTSLIFPSSIRSVDLGSKSIIADKAVNIENVLNVKAAQIGFNETNFSVITNDGRFYSFICNYNEYPKAMAYNLAKIDYKGTSANKVDISFNEGNGDKMNDIQDNLKRVHKKTSKEVQIANMYDMIVRITGLYVKDNTYYVKTEIVNRSNINYNIEFMRFFVVDKKILKSTSQQEYELSALAQAEEVEVINAGEKVENVFAFNKFTIPNNKIIKIMLNEANGGRNMTLNLDYDAILNAKKL